MDNSFKDQIDFRDGRRCALCGRGNPEVDIGRHHIFPRSEGGVDHINNVITLCQRHHSQADNRQIDRSVLYDIVKRRNDALDWNVVRIERRRKESKRRERRIKHESGNRRNPTNRVHALARNRALGEESERS